MRALLLAMVLLTGCPIDEPPKEPPCGGKMGKHCGCRSTSCTNPCYDCCKVIPCPPDTCGIEH